MNRSEHFVAALIFSSVVLSSAQVWGAATQSYQATGNLGLEISAVSNLAGQLPAMTGTFNLAQIPPGAVVQKAFVYTADWANSAGLTLNFPGVPFPGDIVAGFFQSDTSTVINQLYGYRWDVTPYVIGAPLSYSFKIGYNPIPPGGTHGNQIGGAALVVVWQDPLAPLSTVSIVDGAIQVGENTPTFSDTETMTFSGLPAGATSLYTFTVADDVAGSNEVVQYNGNTVGGPIDENLGLGASLLTMNTTSLAGSNTVSITSPADHFGWIFSATIVPEPSTLALAAIGGAALMVGLIRRRYRG